MKLLEVISTDIIFYSKTYLFLLNKQWQPWIPPIYSKHVRLELVEIWSPYFQLRLLEASTEDQPDAIEAARVFRCEKITELEKKLAQQIERNLELEKELSCEVSVMTVITISI